MAKYKPPPPEEGAPGWMMTFGDMCTLLLTFFVLLVSMMVIDPKKYTTVLGTFADTGGVGFDRPDSTKPVPKEDYFVQIIKASARRNTRPDGGEVVGAEGEAVRVFAFRDNYVVQVAEQSFFADMSILLTPEGMNALTRIAAIIKDTKMNRVRLSGHYSESENPDRWNNLAEEVVTRGGGKTLYRALPFKRYDPRSQTMVDENKLLTGPSELAAWRAEAVKEFMVSQGIPAKNIEAINGGMLGSIIKSGLEAFSIAPLTNKKTTMPGITGVVREGSAESKAPVEKQVGNMTVRNWPSFVFVEHGGDSGRTVSIAVTGEVVADMGPVTGPTGGN